MLLSYCLCIGLSLFFGSACWSEMPERAIMQTYQLAGKIVEGRYYGCNDCFSVAVPEYAAPHHIEDEYFDHKLGGVAFYNDDGYFVKVEIDELLPEVKSIIGKHPHIKEEVLEAIVEEAVLPQLKSEARNLQLLHQQKVFLDDGEPAQFIVLNLPGAASIINRNTGRSFDSKRGYLFVFSKNSQLVTFCMQDPYSLMPRFAESAKIHLNERLLNHLNKLQRTFQ